MAELKRHMDVLERVLESMALIGPRTKPEWR